MENAQMMYFFDPDNKDVKTISLLDLKTGKFRNLQMPYSETEYINFISADESGSYYFVQTSPMIMDSQITNFWVLDRTGNTWSKNLRELIPDDTALLQNENTSVNSSWVSDNGTGKPLVNIEYQRFRPGSQDTYKVAEYLYNPETQEIKAIKSPCTICGESGGAEIPDLTVENIETVGDENMNSTGRQMEQAAGAVASAPLFLGARLIGKPIMYIPEKSEACDGPCMNNADAFIDEPVSGRYIRVTNPVIGKQKLTYIDKINGVEKEMISWFSSWNYNDITAQFVPSANAVLVVANERLGVFDIETGSFTWITEVEYNRGAFSMDDKRPYMLRVTE
jgi:hypothetical protein